MSRIYGWTPDQIDKITVEMFFDYLLVMGKAENIEDETDMHEIAKW